MGSERREGESVVAAPIPASGFHALGWVWRSAGLVPPLEKDRKSLF